CALGPARFGWPPTVRAEVAKVALPAASSVPVPRVVVPSLKLTVPVAPAGVRVAVKDTGWANVDGLVLEAIATVVGILSTFWLSGPEADGAWVGSPSKTAVIGWSPT